MVITGGVIQFMIFLTRGKEGVSQFLIYFWQWGQGGIDIVWLFWVSLNKNADLAKYLLFFLNTMHFCSVIHFFLFLSFLILFTLNYFWILFFLLKRYCFFNLLECKKKFWTERRGVRQFLFFFWQGGMGGRPISGGMEHFIHGVWSTSFLADTICERPLK